MRSRLLFCSVLLVATASASALAFGCSGKKLPPKEPNITEVVADAGVEDAEPPRPTLLYDRLGGKENIAKFVELFIKNVTSSDVTKKRFARLSKERLEKFRSNLVEQLCKETGGDCTYTKDMKAVHKGMKITEAEWQVTVAALNAALEEAKVGKEDAADLVAIIAPMHDDIVEVKDKPKPGAKK